MPYTSNGEAPYGSGHTTMYFRLNSTFIFDWVENAFNFRLYRPPHEGRKAMADRGPLFTIDYFTLKVTKE